ncbi:MAG: glycosyltransferase family 39 protein [Tenacibaculum sp.]
MVILIIRLWWLFGVYISKLLFSTGELSVRFLSAVSLSLTYYIAWKLIDYPKKNSYIILFIISVLSFFLISIYGFITVPDTPLLFFMVIFLLGYKKYLNKKSFISYLLITVGIVGMLYSKYPSVLIVFFVVISNIKMLKNIRIWVVFLFVLLLYLPHLYWQYTNDFSSFKYHLFERMSSKYRFDFTLVHLLNMAGVVGLAFPVVYYAFFKSLKNKSLFNKSLVSIVFGFFLFFLLFSLKTHVQMQWLMPISVPLLIISFKYFIDYKKSRKVFIWLASFSIIITFILRVLITTDTIVVKKIRISNNKNWTLALLSKYKDADFLFQN